MTERVTVKTAPGSRAIEWIARYGAILGMLLLLVAFQLVDNRFMRPANLVGVLNSSTILIILSVAIMMVMSVRGIDLSVAQVADASSVIAAMLILAKQPVWIAVAVAVGFGVTVGLINGTLMAYLGVPAIIGSLGMMFVVRSFELMLTNGAQPQILFTLTPKITRDFFFLGTGSLGPVPMLIVLCTVLVIIMYFVKERSVLGRHMSAIQGNVRTAFLTGVNIRRVFGATFLFSATLAAIAGVLVAARAGTAVPRGIETYLTDCFVSVYIGTLISEDNRFSVIGTVIGALFVGFLNNFFTLMSMGAAYKNLFNGLFIIAAVALGALRRRR